MVIMGIHYAKRTTESEEQASAHDRWICFRQTNSIGPSASRHPLSVFVADEASRHHLLIHVWSMGFLVSLSMPIRASSLLAWSRLRFDRLPPSGLSLKSLLSDRTCACAWFDCQEQRLTRSDKTGINVELGQAA